ncbi:hypothetical protein ACFFHF_17300 [Robertmurraya beringensis]|uniref:Uncharacterized protein n=1 Tax=Robertmurraya beringensis TaxID=641660 RepID=A0ABV6KUF7_9BACI
MNSAMLHNGQVVTAAEYNPDTHGKRIYCIDKACKTNIIYVPGTDSTVPYFKTTGKNEDSKHKQSCGFFKILTFEESIAKVNEYQDELLDKGFPETIIRLNMAQLDPDYQKKVVEKEESQQKKVKDPNEIKVKQESTTPNSISTLKAVVKLLTLYEPDTLATILVSVKGRKIPLSKIVVSSERAHELAWSGEADDTLSYFVYGTIRKVIRREKVIYLNFEPVNNVVFSLVIFDKYFKHFTYKDEQLVDRKVLAYGFRLKKNEFKGKNTSELHIKSNKYIEFLP